MITRGIRAMLAKSDPWRFWPLNRLWPDRAVREETEAFLRHVYNLARLVSPGPCQPFPWERHLHPASQQSRQTGSSEHCLISFLVPIYNTKPEYLVDLVNSLAVQQPAPFELVLSDDGSTDPDTLASLLALEAIDWIRIVRHPNGHISKASNRALAVARGTWVGLIDHDDALFPYAVTQILALLEADPDAALIYTDEVIADARLCPRGLMLKPAWDPVLFSGVNYTNHLTLYRRDRLEALGGWREGFEGSQDYDLMLRYTNGLPERAIRHLPYPAYLWRRDGESYSARFLDGATERARRALAEHYAPRFPGITAGPALVSDLHRINFQCAMTSWPRISIILPNKNSPALVSQVLSGLFEQTDYPDFEVIIVDNGSDDPKTLALYAQYADQPGFVLDQETRAFNFSYAVNRGIERASGEHILLLNNDVEILEPDWLKEMVACLNFPDAGIVGAKLLYPDRTTQHLGVIAGYGSYAGHWYLGQQEDFYGPMNRFSVRQSLEIVTGACFLIARRCLDQIGGFDEVAFPIAYNDVDYCLRARKAGFRVIFTPFACLIHHESASRGSDETAENRARFEREKAALEARHQTSRYLDPALNPWYSRTHSVPQLVFQERLAKPK
ncbi:glycosyltransferase family 2 protein [Rhabdaerophilum sp. SD176]|uniref:glycosyltransferase family 2 protein n=1 Tax=Rhabdaerophilum sp. SD176 TaxID=2983548 RepID=UPI0024E024D1|nr:glycosyltransferase family 2 protein [Rhabdaerophilum sp. SD176]